ncbi:MAG TPA: thioredoxin domain-containing protein [Sphingomicrobium sp.]|nr:thioredoxin domain-containing protein [Sphingomicrobium sp.]
MARSAAPVDWSRTVVKTPAGGFQMGNPKARVKLVEYGSLACPHCRDFNQIGVPPLVQHYVRPGRVSYEFRSFLLNGPDVSVSLLAHCAGPAKFFPMSRAVFDSQPEWLGKIAALTEAQRAEFEQMDDQQRLARIGEIAGFPQIAARFGVTAARARQCLTDSKATERLVGITRAAADAGIAGTPTFLINGEVTGAATWEQLEPLLKKAAGR